MIRIGPVPLALLGWIVSVSSVMLLPAAAQAACSQWDVSENGTESGGWRAMQSNGSQPWFRLQQTGTLLQGDAGYLTYDNGEIDKDIHGSVDGTINGDSL